MPRGHRVLPPGQTNLRIGDHVINMLTRLFCRSTITFCNVIVNGFFWKALLMKKLLTFFGRYCYAAVSCIYLFSIGFVFKKNYAIITDICIYFGYVKKAQRVIIPKVKLSDIYAGKEPVQICEPVNVDGNISLLELVSIITLIKLRRPHEIFEIGTFDGRTTLNMAFNSSREAKIYTLDLPKEQMNSTKYSVVRADKALIDKNESGLRFIGTDSEKKITQLYGDSAEYDFSPYFGKIDFMFVDGAHTYDYVKNDTKVAFQLLNDGKGLVLWHDYGQWEGVTTALNELYLNDGKFRNLKHIEGTSLVFLIIG